MIKNEFRALGGMSTWEEEMGEREREERGTTEMWGRSIHLDLSR